MAKDAYYFSHDSNAKDDPKCVLLIEQLGMEGYGIFWVLIETLREQPNYKYPIILLPALARRFNTTAEKMKTVVSNYNLFVIDDKDFFSISLMGRMKKLESKREQQRQAGLKSAQKRLLNSVDSNISTNECSTDVQRTFNECSTSVATTLEACSTSKVKKSKYIYSAFFESVWNLYPNKKGKASVKEKQKKILHELGFDTIKNCIDRYKESKPDWQQWQNGSTFFNSGYIDYMDENYISNESQEDNLYKEVD
jgi:hypothetical protein